MLAALLTLFAFAQEPDATIVVEARRAFEVYVAPVEVNNHTQDIEAVIGEGIVFANTSTSTHLAKVYNGNGGYESILVNHNKFDVYNKDTIKYAWENCNYEKDAKACSHQNNHFLLETVVTVDENQLVVSMLLYDSNMQVVSRSTVVSNKIIKWIRQQQVTVQRQNSVYISQGIPDCNIESNNCIDTIDSAQQKILIHKPVENLPIKWEIPHRLMENHMRQATVLLWVSTRIE